MFKRILIANRGEIACRIARTCRRLGIEFVAVYSEADAESEHLKGAVCTVCLGAGPASESYLDVDKLLDAALSTACEAVHPGYGFLSENSGFAAAVEKAGMVFIGPAPETIAALGDKARAKSLMQAAGVPVVPGSNDASDDPNLIEEQIRTIGLPVLLKPSAGGGGKGMQIIAQYDGLPSAIDSAIRVARNSFGDGRMIVERYIENPRHIEVQIFGDGNGNVVHLFERECSLQRRHQKVIEEAPAPNFPAQARERLLEAALLGASSLAYRNAGTFEFIVGPDFECYFLEVNTRLQVEHPVTEEITGQDLVEWQLRVAAGQGLPLTQDEIGCTGHAMEARIYAEDPAQDFRPSPGEVLEVHWPDELRVDSSLTRGGSVPPFYDPMVAKLIARAADRRASLELLRQGLSESVLLGIKTNIGYLIRVLTDAEVVEGNIHTRYLDEQKALQLPLSKPAAAAVAAAISLPTADAHVSPWMAGASEVLNRKDLDTKAPVGRLRFFIDQEITAVGLVSLGNGQLITAVQEEELTVQRDATGQRGRVNEWRWAAFAKEDDWLVQVAGDHYVLAPVAHSQERSDEGAQLTTAPMSGVIAALLVKEGDRVRAGEVLAVIEAMKMEHAVLAKADGLVQTVKYHQGQSVREGDMIVDVAYEPVAV